MHTDFLFYIIKKKNKLNINMYFIQCNFNKHKFNIHMDSLRYICFGYYKNGCVFLIFRGM